MPSFRTDKQVSPDTGDIDCMPARSAGSRMVVTPSWTRSEVEDDSDRAATRSPPSIWLVQPDRTKRGGYPL